jgi:hypothetical protein
MSGHILCQEETIECEARKKLLDAIQKMKVDPWRPILRSRYQAALCYCDSILEEFLGRIVNSKDWRRRKNKKDDD